MVAAYPEWRMEGGNRRRRSSSRGCKGALSAFPQAPTRPVPMSLTVTRKPLDSPRGAPPALPAPSLRPRRRMSRLVPWTRCPPSPHLLGYALGTSRFSVLSPALTSPPSPSCLRDPAALSVWNWGLCVCRCLRTYEPRVCMFT